VYGLQHMDEQLPSWQQHVPLGQSLSWSHPLSQQCFEQVPSLQQQVPWAQSLSLRQ